MSGLTAPRRSPTRRALALVGSASLLWGAPVAMRAAPVLAQSPNAVAVTADLDRVKRFIELIDQKKLFIQKESDGLGMVTLEQVDADVQAKEVDLELDDSSQAREAAARAHAENLEKEVNRRYGETRRYLPLLEEQRRELEQQLAKLGAPATTPSTATPSTIPSSPAAFRGGLKGSWEITCLRGPQKLEYKNGGVWYLEFAGDGTISGRFEDYQGTPRPARGRIEESGIASGDAVNIRWSATFDRDGNSLAMELGRGSLSYSPAVFDAEPGLECTPGRWWKI